MRKRGLLAGVRACEERLFASDMTESRSQKRRLSARAGMSSIHMPMCDGGREEKKERQPLEEGVDRVRDEVALLVGVERRLPALLAGGGGVGLVKLREEPLLGHPLHGVVLVVGRLELIHLRRGEGRVGG